MPQHRLGQVGSKRTVSQHTLGSVRRVFDQLREEVAIKKEEPLNTGHRFTLDSNLSAAMRDAVRRAVGNAYTAKFDGKTVTVSAAEQIPLLDPHPVRSGFRWVLAAAAALAAVLLLGELVADT